ncbi:MAG: diguanylate cyclase (GGDEF)-like protein/PAS domain S-box-containing protein [Gammaproteobacteria bacterium]|jgi:diguanylate cyclase (GGDEF)-like protein/PAS domain S-box-containing protein
MKDLISNKLAGICPDPVIGVNREGKIALFNPAAEKLLGYKSEDVINKTHISCLYHPPGAGKELKKLIYSDGFGGPGLIQQHETQLRTKGGSILPILISATLIIENDEEIGSVGFFHDLTLQKELEASLKSLAITDGLTGLYNQRHFYTVLSQETARCQRYERPLSLICIDVDNFKKVNDSLGHLEGDSLLRYVAKVVNTVARSNDHGFRYGGDEYMLLLPEADKEKALSVAARLVEQFEKNQPASLTDYNRGDLPLSLSIGVSEFSSDEQSEMFVKRADFAMYQAKRVSGNNIEFME